MITEAWLVGTSMVLQMDKLENSLAPGYLNAATVTATVRDATTDVVLGGPETWPVTLPYVGGSDGRYRITLNHAVVVRNGQRLLVHFIVVNGALKLEKYKEMIVTQDS